MALQDVAGRWGGEQLRVSVERMRFTTLDGQPLTLTSSIGVHALSTSHEDDRDDMIGAADRALYRAKDMGRNRVEQLWRRGLSPRRRPGLAATRQRPPAPAAARRVRA